MSRRMLCAVALLSLLAAPAWASQARAVRLSYIEGDVQIDRGDTHGFNSAFLNMPVIEGTRLWTRNSGRVEVEFEDGSTARLAPDTIMTFQQLRLENGQRVTLVNLQDGEAYFDLNKHREDDIIITVGQHSLAPTKASHFRLGVSKEEFNLAVFKGDVELLKRNGERVQVKKNETLTLAFEDPDRYYLAKGISEGAQDFWDRERESSISANANRRDVAYGVSGLNQYGSFITVNSYGNVWRPYGVGYGWSPFQDGSWVNYPGQGFVWVSPYNWGWTPYHYGSWVNVGGYGWCWRPGSSYAWNPVPVIVNPPPNFVPHPPPPGVGIVHIGHGGDRIDLGRGRIHREGTASGGTQFVGNPVASTPAPNTNTGASIVNAREGRGNRDGVTVDRMQDGNAATSVKVPTVHTPEVDLDRGGRGRSPRTPQVNPTPTPTQPAVATAPAAVPSPAPVQVQPAATSPAVSRGERGGRGENGPQNDRPSRSSSDFERPARTYTPPPQQPASAPARTYTPPPTPVQMSSPPHSAPASAPSGGERPSRSSRGDPK